MDDATRQAKLDRVGEIEREISKRIKRMEKLDEKKHAIEFETKALREEQTKLFRELGELPK